MNFVRNEFTNQNYADYFQEIRPFIFSAKYTTINKDKLYMENQIKEFLYRHLGSIIENDLENYHATTSEDLTLYEWFVTPHRIDGIPFHDFMMESNSARGTVFGAAEGSGDSGSNFNTRFDLANLHIQVYENTAVASYTLLISTSLPTGVQVRAHNETRIIVKLEGNWKVVHVHKSPAWEAPHTQP
jgi:hypothetical protein